MLTNEGVNTDLSTCISLEMGLQGKGQHALMDLRFNKRLDFFFLTISTLKAEINEVLLMFHLWVITGHQFTDITSLYFTQNRLETVQTPKDLLKPSLISGLK